MILSINPLKLGLLLGRRWVVLNSVPWLGAEVGASGNFGGTLQCQRSSSQIPAFKTCTVAL